jgi:Flp pilus assembly protein TadG
MVVYMNVINHIAASQEASIRAERRRRGLRTGSDEGQSVLEFALCVPVLLLIVTGITTFGIALNNYLTMTNAISTSAQLVSVNRSNTTDPCSLAATAFASAAPNLNSTNLKFSFVLNGTAYPSSGTYSGSTGSTCSSSSTTTGAAGNLVAGQPAKVTVSYPCNLTVYGHNYLPSCNLVVQTTEIVQ